MNHTYRLVWSQLSNTWVAVAENAKGKGKSIGGRKLLATALALVGGSFCASLMSAPAYAADAANASVTSGVGHISQNGTTTTINQGSQNLAIDWTSLSTAANEALIFNQPNRAAIALNRITGSSPSVLLGSLSANGQVFILNPNGVLFGAGAQINVGGLVASTLGLSNADLEAGKISFAKGASGNGSVVNQGEINTVNGGYVALIAGTVRNEGKINAQFGTALLAAGDKVTLNLNNGSLLGYSIDQGALNALAENKQLIQANGGQVLMSAKALNNLTTAVVNNTGLIEAKTVQNQNGRIMLMSDMQVGTVNVDGKLDASAPDGGDGGFIETSAAHVKVASGTQVTTKSASGLTGTWLIDPNDFTIAASGGDMTGADVSANLNNTNFEIQTATMGTVGGNGDIHVNDAVTWNAATTLTLSAERNININQSITSQHANGKLSLQYGLGAVAAGNTATYNVKAPVNLKAGDNFSTRLGSDGVLTQYKVITELGAEGSVSKNDLQGIRGNTSGNYVLGSDIDAAASAVWASGSGFQPITSFAGVFDGLGHVISNLTINRPTTMIGLFGSAVGANIRNVGIVGGSMIGEGGGALVGFAINTTLANVFSTANITGTLNVGGLVGIMNDGTRLVDAYATGSVEGVGVNSAGVGGLVGSNEGQVSNAYATGRVTGFTSVGGLIGSNRGQLNNAYATGDVITSSSGDTGGLVGVNSSKGVISYAYATGNVAGYIYAGGLVGRNEGSITKTYATGKVTGDMFLGGLIGYNMGMGTAANSYWDSVTSGISVAVGGSNNGSANVGSLSNSASYQHASYTDFGTWNQLAGAWVATDSNGQAWAMLEGSTRPFLYSEYSTTIRNLHQLQLMALNTTASYTVASDIDASASNGSNASGMWSTQGFSPVGAHSGLEFTGSFNGNNHTISNLTINMPTLDAVGLFGSANGATISNVRLIGGNIVGNNKVGALVGYLSGGSISNAHADASVKGEFYVGGLVGENDGGTVDNVSTSGGVTGGSGNIGGLIGNNFGIIRNAHATSHVTGTNTMYQQGIGGLVGYNSSAGTIADATASGNVNADLNVGTAGGLVGINDGALIDVQASGQVSGYIAGGLVGNNLHDISDASASGNVTGAYAGGLIGDNSGDIKDAHASGNVTGLRDNSYGGYVGGLIGLNAGKIETSYATGDIHGQVSQYAGGLLGSNSGAVSDSYAEGKVTGGDDANHYAGGLIGQNSGRITDSHATGDVSGNYAGGLVGKSSNRITDSYATGAVTGYYAGGLVGHSSNRITGSHATGAVTGTITGDQDGYAGGLVGLSEGTITNSYATGVVIGQREGVAGGLVGESSASITGSRAEGSVSGYYAGGLVGKSFSGITNSYALGDVTGYIAGGLVGESRGSISMSYATGKVDGRIANVTTGLQDGFAGGLIGQNYEALDDVYASGNVTGSTSGQAGGLIGYHDSASVNNAYATGNVTAHVAGGLIAQNDFGQLANVHASGNVTGDTYAGGLVGNNSGNISDAYATGTVTGYNAGGLVGSNTRGTVTAAYASGNVTGVASGNAGGLIGDYSGSDTISNVYATGNVIGGTNGNVGGLVGSVGNGFINDAYASGEVTGQGYAHAGGIVGYNDGGTIYNVYATGKVSGGVFVGGVAGYNGWSIYQAFWNTQASGNATAVGDGDATDIAGINSTQAKQQATFSNAGWDMGASGGTSTIWRIYEGQSGPLLRSFLTAVTVTGTASGKTYNGTASTSSAYTTDVNGAALDGSLTYTSDSKNVGSYSTANSNLQQSGLYSGQQGYDISYADASLTINKANLSVSTSDVTKTYDGTTNAAGSIIVSSGTVFSGDTLSGGDFAFSNKNAGTGKTVVVSNASINDGNSGNNYNITYLDNTTSTINKADVTLSTSDVVKTYDATNAASGNLITTSGTIFSGDTLSGGSFSYSHKRAGVGNKTVNVWNATIADGNGGNNYNVTYVANTTSTINKADISVTTTDVVKTYDGTTSAAGSIVVTSGVLYGDDIVNGGEFAFSDRDAGTGKTVSVTNAAVHDSNGGNNYNVTYIDNTTSTINKADLSVTAQHTDKIYDGTVNAGNAIIGVLAGAAVSEFIGTGGGQSFDDRNVGSNKTVQADNVTVHDRLGNDVTANYNITYTDNVTSTIDRANVTLSSSDVVKTYDGTTSAAGSLVVEFGGIFNGDVLSGGDFAFADKNADTWKTVLVSNAVINDGNGGNNYNIIYSNNTSSTIHKADLSLSTSDVIRTYDGTTNAAGNLIVSSGTVFSGDSLNGATFKFANKHAGAGDKTVIVRDAAIDDGNGGNNYNVTYVNNTTSTINKADVTLSTYDVTKTYDGTRDAFGELNVISGTIFSGDGLEDAVFTFTDKNVGNGNKTVTVSDAYIFDRNGGNNYNVTYVDNTTSTIEKAELTVTANSSSKVYDGIAYTGNNGSLITGFVNGETIADLSGELSYGGTAQGASEIGNYTITNQGLSSSNYTLSFVNGTLIINPVVVTLSNPLGALAAAYDSARTAVSDLPDDKETGTQIASLELQNNSANDASQLTPRLHTSTCGVQMPPSANSAACP